MWCLLVCLFIIPFVGLILLLAGLYLRYRGFWELKGFSDSLPVTSFWKHFFYTLFVTKSHGDADLAVYKELSGKKFAGVIDMLGPNVWILDPELMRHVFVKDFDHFVDRFIFDQGERMEYMNLNVTNLSGQKWKDVRNVLTPAFTSGKIKRIFPSFSDCGKELEAFFESMAEKGDEFELKDAYGRFTMDVIAASAFGVKCNSFKEKDALFPRMARNLLFPGASAFLMTVGAFLFPRFVKFLRAIRLPLPNNEEPMNFFADVVKDTIADREKTGIKGNDFLQMLLDARKGELEEEAESDHIIGYSKATDHKTREERKEFSKAVLNDSLLIAQCILFFNAGYETTSNTLSYIAYELALNPEVQEKLHEEVEEVVSRHKGQVTYDGILEMNLLEKIIHETLRLHAPIFRNLRLCTKDYKIPGSDAIIPKGMLVSIPEYALHLDEQYFPNPKKFDPERFSHEEKAKRCPYIYQPFGHGPRNCVGMRFALMETKAAMAMTILHFRFRPSQKTEIPLKYSFISPVSRPKNGVWLHIEKRE